MALFFFFSISIVVRIPSHNKTWWDWQFSEIIASIFKELTLGFLPLGRIMRHKLLIKMAWNFNYLLKAIVFPWHRVKLQEVRYIKAVHYKFFYTLENNLFPVKIYFTIVSKGVEDKQDYWNVESSLKQMLVLRM